MKRVLIFTGDGKGKTTAAVGMAIRAIGHEKDVLIMQFVKNDSTVGEFNVLARIPYVEIFQMGLGFINHNNIEPHKNAAQKGLDLVKEKLAANHFDMVILDEILVAIGSGLISEDDVIDVINHLNDGTVLILTGRGLSPRLADFADTVTEMKSIKHGYDIGIKAQDGVEK